MDIIKKRKRGDVVIALLLAKNWFDELTLQRQLTIQPEDFVIAVYHDYNNVNLQPWDECRLDGKTTKAICKDRYLAEVAYEFAKA